MARKYGQRNNNPEKEYKRLVRNTKAKMRRLQDDYGIDLTDKIEIPKFDELDTPDKFDEFSERMESFTDRGNLNYQFRKNDKGVVYSLQELNEGIANTMFAQEKARQFIDKYKDNPYFIAGEEAGYTVGDRMLLYEKENVAGISVPDDFNINAFESRSRLKGRLELLEEKASGKFFDQSMSRMKENFMKALRGSYNSDADDVLNMIDIVPPDDFFELFIMKAEFTFEDYASDGSIDGSETQLNILRGYLESYFRGEIDMDMKQF